mgnify:CR=1 FL=1
MRNQPKKTVYNRQTEQARANGTSNCPLCAIGTGNNRTRIYKLSEMDADHVTAWRQRRSNVNRQLPNALTKRTTAPKATSSTLIPLFRKQRHKLGLTPHKLALIYVAYKSFIGQNNQPSLVVLLCSAENAFVVFVLRNAQRTFIFGKLQQFMV